MKKLYNLITNNFQYKLLAVVFSILLWFLATNKEIVDTTITVNYKPVPKGNYKVVDYSPRKITLRIEGYRKDILSLEGLKEVKLILPPNIEGSGWKTIRIRKDNIQLPVESVKLKKVSPKMIKVKIEKLYRKIVPVVLNAEDIPKGAKVKIDPNYAVVLLPEDKKDFVFEVKTERIDLKGVKLPATFVLKLKTVYSVEPKEVKITLEEKR